ALAVLGVVGVGLEDGPVLLRVLDVAVGPALLRVAVVVEDPGFGEDVELGARAQVIAGEDHVGLLDVDGAIEGGGDLVGAGLAVVDLDVLELVAQDAAQLVDLVDRHHGAVVDLFAVGRHHPLEADNTDHFDRRQILAPRPGRGAAADHRADAISGHCPQRESTDAERRRRAKQVASRDATLARLRSLLLCHLTVLPWFVLGGSFVTSAGSSGLAAKRVDGGAPRCPRLCTVNPGVRPGARLAPGRAWRDRVDVGEVWDRGRAFGRTPRAVN